MATVVNAFPDNRTQLLGEGLAKLVPMLVERQKNKRLDEETELAINGINASTTPAQAETIRSGMSMQARQRNGDIVERSFAAKWPKLTETTTFDETGAQSTSFVNPQQPILPAGQSSSEPPKPFGVMMGGRVTTTVQTEEEFESIKAVNPKARMLSPEQTEIQLAIDKVRATGSSATQQDQNIAATFAARSPEDAAAGQTLQTTRAWKEARSTTLSAFAGRFGGRFDDGLDVSFAREDNSGSYTAAWHTARSIIFRGGHLKLGEDIGAIAGLFLVEPDRHFVGNDLEGFGDKSAGEQFKAATGMALHTWQTYYLKHVETLDLLPEFDPQNPNTTSKVFNVGSTGIATTSVRVAKINGIIIPIEKAKEGR